jgi:hypothetical protein
LKDDTRVVAAPGVVSGLQTANSKLQTANCKQQQEQEQQQQQEQQHRSSSSSSSRC